MAGSKRNAPSAPEKSNKRTRSTPDIKRSKKKVRAVLNNIVERPTTSGHIFVCGTNDFGQLGIEGDEKNRPVPIKSVIDIDFVDVISGGLHSFAMTPEGSLFSWGCTDEGVLGREGKNDEPVKIEIEETFVKVVAGDCINMALTKDGNLYTWGTYRGADGAFGFSPTLSQQSTPLLFSSLSKETIVDITTGTNHSLALSADGRLFTWGYGEQGQLGRRISSRHPKDSLRCEPLSLKNVKLIGAGSYHSLAVTHDNQLYAWGLNNFRQCANSEEPVIFSPTLVPLPESIGTIVAVDGGEHFTVIVNEAGEVFTFGRGDANQLGLPEDVIAPLKLSSTESAFKFIIPVATKVPNLPPVSQISVGSEFVLTACINGEGYSWGFNSSNAIGNGNDDDEPVPCKLKGKNLGTSKIVRVAAGGQHSVFLTKSTE
ncbi:hypothetical protein G6F46_006396 [Rhizopus delemar]|uniref:RCC1-like domain-containing protein n=3 Tax=Rhizopus TaxID=4842 RepID=I1BXL6_RHIO9|nr:hypothetical protein RO3G_05651 [Rhizopus delemar RA 99-880]KAG1459129.1 hypothetical protein G6F55_004950 [Rhizopus delemar]KAG1543690.1 hypothetical protein G6F51_006525 [Rhizopus arrhizus]KAG1497524.1 hypothetical protein G6F54_005708 [Rhizopus delemar]KAG1511313.1 hypothetical protein G6F53_006036 [Rhizopus delemar]|eukprot:EIE80946.1 hypothetical protein RO3G_05651 [Rhizopus delemar RA 99-880]